MEISQEEKIGIVCIADKGAMKAELAPEFEKRS